MKREDIHRILNIKEAYRLPDVLMKILLNNERKNKVFDEFLKIEQSLEYDWFTEYFQDEQGDRKNLKQDFTPDAICELVSRLTNKNEVADICAGTGGLTLKQWNNRAKDFFCLEYSERTIPILLFNLAIRNVNAVVVHGDALTNEICNYYKLQKTDRYSEIFKIDEYNTADLKFETIITNPPYSLAWDGDKKRIEEERFKEYGIAPKSKADYAFLLDALYKLKDNGTLVAILPHGVLFRGQSEGEIRKKIVEKNLIDMIIGLPEKLFLNTTIPTCVIVFKKNKTNNNILFIDASKEFIKNKAYNLMTDEHLEKILKVIAERKNVDKFSKVATFGDIKNNDFNLNIPRYVDTYEEEVITESMTESMQELLKISKEIVDTEKELFKFFSELASQDLVMAKELEEAKEIFKEVIESNELRVKQLELFAT